MFFYAFSYLYFFYVHVSVVTSVTPNNILWDSNSFQCLAVRRMHNRGQVGKKQTNMFSPYLPFQPSKTTRAVLTGDSQQETDTGHVRYYTYCSTTGRFIAKFAYRHYTAASPTLSSAWTPNVLFPLKVTIQIPITFCISRIQQTFYQILKKKRTAGVCGWDENCGKASITVSSDTLKQEPYFQLLLCADTHLDDTILHLFYVIFRWRFGVSAWYLTHAFLPFLFR